jgi:predicted P-loop ATPase
MGVERCPFWLTDYCHADSSEYVQAVGVRWLLQCVQRAFEPGCQADHVLILEGNQGLRKSSILRALAIRDDWFADSRLNVEDQRAAADRIQGRWIYELAEFPQRKADADKLKDFLTNRVDRYRPVYARLEIDRRRRTVFAATINPPPGGGYLMDDTGGRRFWPVRVGGVSGTEKLNVEALQEAAPQLWAEAVVRYRRGEAAFLENDNLEALARQEQEERQAEHPWVEQLALWAQGLTETTTADALDKLQVPPERQTKQSQMVAAATLRKLGFTNRQREIRDGVEVRVYRKPGRNVWGYVIRLPRGPEQLEFDLQPPNPQLRLPFAA